MALITTLSLYKLHCRVSRP